MRELIYEMSPEAYKHLLNLDGIKTKEKLLAYINDTYGLLGKVVQIAVK